MSSYMMVKTEIWSRNHEVFNSKEELLEEIEDNKKEIERIKKQLFGLCCGNPRELLNTKDVEGYESDPIEILERKFNELVNQDDFGLEALITTNNRLQIFYDNWDNIEK